MSTKNEKPTTGSNSRIKLPDGDVLIRKVRGTNGTHPLLGYVKVGRPYAVELSVAVRLTEGREPDFEPEYPEDADQIATVRKSIAQTAKQKA